MLPVRELERRAQRAREMLAHCELCARRCGADRTVGATGTCRTGRLARVASWGAHHGEENPLRGRRGSGTIFFASCNLACAYCQNWDISQADAGREVSAAELAAIMLELQARGCHNVNLVSPSHVVTPLLEAIAIAVRRGLVLPVVYNTGGYDGPEALALLDGVIDIYMPDAKYGTDELGQRYSGVPDYVAVNRAAIREMHRQVGDLVLDEEGIARRGLLVRHLVLPGHAANSEAVLEFLATEISRQTYVNVMDQYHPSFRAGALPPLDRALSAAEHRAALAAARRFGLGRLDP